jgi:AraC family transcriptional activator of pobA
MKRRQPPPPPAKPRAKLSRPARRTVPRFGMSHVPSADPQLREQGVAVIRFMDSVHQDPRRLQPHYHEFFQIFFLRGRARIMHDFMEFNASGHTLVFLSPGQVHTARPAPGTQGHTISFTQAFFDHFAPPPSPLFDFPFFFAAHARPWLSISTGDAPAIADLFAEMQREFDTAQPGAAGILRALLHILLVRAERLYAGAHPPRDVTRATQLTREFQIAVEQHFREWDSVSAYAKALGVTANHLHDVVREQIGRPAGEVIRERRLLDAKRLLLHSDLTAAEIGYRVGFQDPSYFSRFFKRSTQATPAEFRAEIREKYHPKPE